jgi:hypothetical protein
MRLDGLDAGALDDEQTRAGVPKVIEAQPFRQQRRALVLGQLDDRLVAEDGSGRSVVEVVAGELGASLRWATATTTRTARSQEQASTA